MEVIYLAYSINRYLKSFSLLKKKWLCYLASTAKIIFFPFSHIHILQKKTLVKDFKIIDYMFIKVCNKKKLCCKGEFLTFRWSWRFWTVPNLNHNLFKIYYFNKTTIPHKYNKLSELLQEQNIECWKCWFWSSACLIFLYSVSVLWSADGIWPG